MINDAPFLLLIYMKVDVTLWLLSFIHSLHYLQPSMSLEAVSVGYSWGIKQTYSYSSR